MTLVYTSLDLEVQHKNITYHLTICENGMAYINLNRDLQYYGCKLFGLGQYISMSYKIINSHLMLMFLSVKIRAN